MKRDGQMGDVRVAIEQAVTRAVEAHALWPAGAPLVAAVSGGADSLCLLGALLALAERGQATAPGAIVVAHLDHGLRWDAGAADARYVADLAARLGLRCILDRADVAALARREHRSLEDAARRARYAFLRRVAAEVGAVRICTGHTRDDQAETIVLHWLRGSGLAGLAGMAPLAGEIARPLLDITRAQTEAYCAARGWEPRADASNADMRFQRNRIRRELLPLLEGYNPNLRATLARNAALLTADEAYLEAQTDAAWVAISREAPDGFAVGARGTHVPAHGDSTGLKSADASDAPSDCSASISNVVSLDLAALRVQPPALRHRLYRRAVQRLVGSDGSKQGLEARHIALLDRLATAGTTGSALDLPGRLRAILGYHALTFVLSVARSATALDGESAASAAYGEHGLALCVPGMVELPEIGWRVRAWIVEGPAGLDPEPPPPAQPQLAAGVPATDLERAELRVYVDADVAGATLWVRTWRPGDRFRPLGMRHEKKLQDYFADAKVPRILRRRLPLVFGSGHLLWIGGQRIDDRARLTAATRRILALQLEPIQALERAASGR